MNDPKIVVIKRNGTDGPQFPLRTNECLFGRKPECDIRIQLPNVSLEHALVKVDNDRKIKLINLSSCNQTLVNGKAIIEAQIKHLDVLTISDRSFRFEFPSPVQEKEKSPKIHYNLSNTPTEQKTPKMPTPGGSPRTPPAKESLKENIHILRRHSMPLQEEDEDLASRVPQKTPFSMVDVNTEPISKEDADTQHVIETKSSKEQKRRCSKRVSFGPVLSPEQFDRDLPPATPLRRGATPRRASLSDDNSLVPLPFLAKKRRSVAALPQSESIQEECDGGEPLDNESPTTRKQQQKIKGDVYTPDENAELSKNLSEQVVESRQSLGHGQEYASPKESELSEIKEGINPIRRRSSLRLAAKNTSFTELSSSPKVPSSVASPVQCMKEKIEEVMLDSDNYTSDEEEDEFEKTDREMVETKDAELQEIKNKMATPLRAEIKRGLKLRQTKKKMATPLRMEIISGFQLRPTKKKLATPLRREIKSGVQLRKTRKKMATPLRKEIITGIQLRQTKRKMETPLQKEIKSGVQLRQTEKKIATPLKQEIKGGVKLRETKKKMATPLRKEILTGVKLRQTKNKMPTPLRKEITSGVQLRQSKKKMTTPLREEIANGVQLRQTKKKMDTSLQEEIIRGVELRQTMKKIATPLKMEIEEGISLRQTRNKLPTPVRNEIASRPNLRLTKKTMNSRLQDEIKRGSKLRKTKQTMKLELQIEIIKGKKLKSTKKSLPTPVRKQVEEGIVLKHVKTSSKRKRSEDGSQRKKLKLSPINGSADSNEGQNTTQIRRALKTPLRKEIVAGKKLRPTRQRMATPLRKQIHAKPTLRAIRRKSIAATVLTKTVPRKPTYAEIVKRRLKKRTGPRQEITKMDSAPLATTSGGLARPEASRNAQSKDQSKERRNSTSFNEKKTPRRKSANWMSSLGLAVKDAKTHSAPMEDFEGVAEMFATPPTSLVAAENPPKKQTKGNWLSSLAKVTNGPRRRVGISTEDLAGIAEMFVTPPSVGRFTRSSVEKAATPGEQGLHSIAAVKPTNTPSLRRCEDTRDIKVATPEQNSNASLPSVNADSTSSQAMLHVIEPLKSSKTPSFRHSAEEVVSLQFVTPVHLSRTPSLRSVKKQSSIVTNESPALQLDFVSPLESKQTPSFRPADEAQTVLLKSVGKQRKDRQSLGLHGLRRLLKSPKQTHSVENSEDFFEASLFTSPKPQPKRFSRKSEGLQGVARLLRTPVENGVTTMGSPKLDGLKELMQETKDFASPHFVGLSNLMRTPKATETVDPEDNFNPELFASAEADSSPAKTDTKPAGQRRKNSRLSIPVLDLTSPEAQEKMDKKEDNIARITRAKRTAPKGLIVPEPKRVRRTRASIQQEKESEPENNPKAAEKKRSARVKKNPAANKQTPKRNVFKRTPLDPIIEVPSPGLQSFDNMQQPVTLTPVTQIEKNEAPQEKRQTRRTAVKETKTVGSSLLSCRRSKRSRSEVESSSEESNRVDAEEGRSAKKSKRDEGRKAGSVVTHLKILEEKSKEDSEVEDKTLSSPVKPRVTRNRRAEVIPPERKQANVESTRRSKRGRSKTVEENVSDLKSESTATQRSEDCSSRRRTRNSQAENLTSVEKAGQESVVKLTRRKRGVKPGPLVTREKKVQEEPNLDVKVDGNEVSSPKKERVTRSRRAEVLPHEEKPVINESRRSKRGSKIVEENAPVSKSTKSAPSQNSEEYSSSKRSTRNSKSEKIIVEETTKAHQDSLVKKTRRKRESKRNASSDPVVKESDPMPSASSQEIQENTHGRRSTRRTRNTSPAEVRATVTNDSRQTKSAKNTRSTRQCKQEMESTSRVTRSTKRS